MESPFRLLLLEDQLAEAELILLELRRAGLRFEVHHVDARDGFVAALRARRPDLVLTDYHLPGMNGMDALALAREAYPDLPVLIVSGTVGEERAIEAMRLGATDYVLKHRLERLVPAVTRALQESEDRRLRREAEDRLRLVMESTNEILWDWAPDRGVWRNDALTKLHGYAPDEIQPTRRWWEEKLHPEDRDRVGQSFAEALEIRASWRDEYRFRRADGTYAHLVDRCAIQRDAGGRVVRVVGSAMDVSEMRSLQAQLLQSQKMEALGRLAGGIAHDFNNLLTVIQGSTSLLLDRIAADDLTLRPDLEEIGRAAEQAGALTSQLLAYARRQVNEPTMVRLSDLVASVTGMLRRLIGEDIELVTELDPACPSVEADGNHLKQVLLNLAVNARDAMPGGGRLILRCRASARRAPGVELEVEDTGRGIDEATLGQIFEPFYTTKAHGTGLGLATLHSIVTSLGGRVEVESTLGEGSLFRIWLPACGDDGAPATPPPAAAPVPVGKGETILVVEDDEAVRRLVTRILSKRGYRVLAAQDGAEGLEVALRHAPELDLLLTDTVMPRMGGLELRQRLRGAGLEVPTLCMSGYVDVVDADRDVHWLQKPFTPDELVRKIREGLSRRGLPAHPPAGADGP